MAKHSKMEILSIRWKLPEMLDHEDSRFNSTKERDDEEGYYEEQRGRDGIGEELDEEEEEEEAEVEDNEWEEEMDTRILEPIDEWTHSKRKLSLPVNLPIGHTKRGKLRPYGSIPLTKAKYIQQSKVEKGARKKLA